MAKNNLSNLIAIVKILSIIFFNIYFINLRNGAAVAIQY